MTTNPDATTSPQSPAGSKPAGSTSRCSDPTEHARDSTRSRRLGSHPVAGFVVVVIVLAGGLVALVTTGAAAPHLRFGGSGSSGSNASGRTVTGVDLANDASTPVRIEAMRWATPGDEGQEVLVPSDASFPGSIDPNAPPFEPFTMPGNTSRRIFVAARCLDPVTGTDVFENRSHILVVRARPALGPARTVRLQEADISDRPDDGSSCS